MLFKSPRHGVRISEAFHEAANIAPDDLFLADTFELYHPAGTPDGPIYVVNNQEDLLATKEDDAERDAGVEVLFLAAGVRLQRPTEGDAGGSNEMDLVVANVSGLFSRALRLARGSPVQWQIVERFFDFEDTSQPAMTPMSMIVDSVEVTNKAVTMRCTFGDPANFAIPRTTFRRVMYPGLVR